MIAGTKIKLTLLGIFALGAMVGAVGDSFYRTSVVPKERSRTARNEQKSPTETLAERLRLSPEQIIQVDTILKEAGEEYLQLRKEVRPAFDAVRNRQRDKIRAILTPDQQRAYGELLEEWNNRRHRSDRRNGDKGK